LIENSTSLGRRGGKPNGSEGLRLDQADRENENRLAKGVGISASNGSAPKLNSKPKPVVFWGFYACQPLT